MFFFQKEFVYQSDDWLITGFYGVQLCHFYIHFETTGGSCNLIGSNWCDLFTNRTIIALNRIFLLSQWGGYTKNKQAIRFQGLF